LAQRRGVPREQVSRWVRGEHQPSLASLTRVLDALGWRLILGLERDDGVG
jgi:DNA-binding phage protein